jgi:hypothetical protein
MNSKMADSDNTVNPSKSEPPVSRTRDVELEHKIKTIRSALIIGLSSYAEIERLRDDFAKYKRFGPDLIDIGRLRPISQVDFANQNFADALWMLDFVGDQVTGEVAA